MLPRKKDTSPEMGSTEPPSLSLDCTVITCCFEFTFMEHLCGRANRPRDGLGCRRPARRSFLELWTHTFAFATIVLRFSRTQRRIFKLGRCSSLTVSPAESLMASERASTDSRSNLTK